MKRAVFLDRDGVLNRYFFDSELGVLTTPFSAEHFELLPGVSRAVPKLNRLGFLTVVASNQPGVAKGHFDQSTLTQMDQRLQNLLAQKGGKIDKIYYCLHHPVEGSGSYKKECECRKPKPGLLYQAAGDLGISLKESYMVGDSITDVQAGRAAGCRTILIHKYKCDLCQFLEEKKIKPDFIADSLLQAVEIISKEEGKNGNIHR